MSAACTHSSTETVLYAAMELAQNKWLLTIGRDGDRRCSFFIRDVSFRRQVVHDHAFPSSPFEDPSPASSLSSSSSATLPKT